MKMYRVYFNRHAEAPQVWSIDEGEQTSEINVQWVRFDNCNGMTLYNNTKANNYSPSAWFEVRGDAEFTRGGVVIRGNSYVAAQTVQDGRP